VLAEQERLGGNGAHNAVLGLVNLHLQTRQVPPDVAQAFRDEAGKPSEHQGLAKWALGVFQCGSEDRS
jgi:hypothetical protein